MKFASSFLAVGLFLASLATTSPIIEGDGEIALGVRTSEPINTAEADLDLTKRAGSFWCPKTDNGAYGVYKETEFSYSRVDRAMQEGASVLERNGPGWRPKSRDYPHVFNNYERIFSGCTGTLYEYPLMKDKTWRKGGGDNVKQIPDRVVFSVSWDSHNRVIEKLCGVMRHGPGRDFIECTYY
ncbi:uncharacterized protein F4822DRAFT_245220 [Hypoxylon trugodes]|uniref:uncharacterized protein n=1 Tax=Hypoxylon trugodes TaxID=326681 RepID=UPI0021A0282A|nr:uncharacterized protein F4822DRAFT_245220 [Hypoxylon trugodes]KAI1388390.1 hypothetical protein F4822DRAFT_245220 [Hypoxylon trugodes]